MPFVSVKSGELWSQVPLSSKSMRLKLQVPDTGSTSDELRLRRSSHSGLGRKARSNETLKKHNSTRLTRGVVIMPKSRNDDWRVGFVT